LYAACIHLYSSLPVSAHPIVGKTARLRVTELTYLPGMKSKAALSLPQTPCASSLSITIFNLTILKQAGRSAAVQCVAVDGVDTILMTVTSQSNNRDIETVSVIRHAIIPSSSMNRMTTSIP